MHTWIIQITRRICRKSSLVRRLPASPKSFLSAPAWKAAIARSNSRKDSPMSMPPSAGIPRKPRPDQMICGPLCARWPNIPKSLPSAKPASIIIVRRRGEQAVAEYKQKQARIFEQQLEIAVEFGLNCIIHQRTAFDDTIAQLKPYSGKLRGVFHCFGESVERMKTVLEIGSLVSFTGIVTFKNGQNVRDTVAATPSDKFMLETDCPYLAPVPYRGKRCEPAYVKEISETVAQVRMCSLEELSAITCKTAQEFFPKIK